MNEDIRFPTFKEAFFVWLRIGLLSFGGPAGQIALMHKTLVEEKRWISNDHFMHALNYCHFLPGPEAQQLATYVGWLLHRTPGGIMAGTLFVLPGFFVILTLSFLYAVYRHIPAVDAFFYGLKPAVLAIVIGAVLRIGGKSLKNAFSVGLAIAAFLCLFALNIPFPYVIFGAGLLGWIYARMHTQQDTHGNVPEVDLVSQHKTQYTAGYSLRVLATWLPLWLGPVLVLGIVRGWDDIYTRMGIFFSKMAMVTFGGAYAVLTYVAQEAVETYSWLTTVDMMNGLAMAESTPGPLILVLQYVGFIGAYNAPGSLPPVLAAILASMLVVWVTFTPCFLWIFLGAPYVERIRGNQNLSAALAGITSAVVGVVMNLSLWFGLHTLFSSVTQWYGPLGISLPLPDFTTLDIFALLLSVAAIVALTKFKLGMGRVLLGCALVGWLGKTFVF